MRIVFIGSVKFSEQALNKLVDIKSSIVGVCTLEYSDFNSDHVDLSPLSRKNNIPVRYTPSINSEEVFDWISDLAPDVIFCFGWSRLIKKKLLNIPPLGVIGFHPALLPANRGRHPLIWSLILGLKETGSSFFFMDEGADSGDILSQRNVPISEIDDVGTLYDKVSKTALKQIEQFVPTLANTTSKRLPQDHSKANYWRKRGQLDGRIDWRMSAQTIHNLVRGLAKPYVGAHFNCDGKDIKVWKTKTVNKTTRNIEPGKILSVDARGVVVKTGIGAVRLVDIEPQIIMEEGKYL
jgi:methionyl-tRNA formyltransferase